MINKEIIINNEIIPLKIKQSSKRKKTLSFQVNSNGLNIIIPITYNISFLNKFFVKKKDWIYKSWLTQKNNKNYQKKYINGEFFLFIGKTYKLNIIKGSYNGCNIELKNSSLIVKIDNNISEKNVSSIIKLELNKWYKNKALEIISKEAETIIKEYNFNVNEIIVKSYKSKYGQCKGNNIYLNYKIIQLPLNIIKHIILHELCHINHKNHKKDFWNCFKKLDKDCEINRKWLKENGSNKMDFT